VYARVYAATNSAGFRFVGNALARSAGGVLLKRVRLGLGIVHLAFGSISGFSDPSVRFYRMSSSVNGTFADQGDTLHICSMQMSSAPGHVAPFASVCEGFLGQRVF
jgi:hypothetical protein